MSTDSKASNRFTAGLLRRNYDDAERRVKNASKGRQRDIWREAMNKRIEELEKIYCWSTVSRPSDEKNFTFKIYAAP